MVAYAAMPDRPAINQGAAPRFFATSFEEVRLSDGLSEYTMFMDNGGIRYEVAVVTMPTGATRQAEHMCVRNCIKRAKPLH